MDIILPLSTMHVNSLQYANNAHLCSFTISLNIARRFNTVSPATFIVFPFFPLTPLGGIFSFAIICFLGDLTMGFVASEGS